MASSSDNQGSSKNRAPQINWQWSGDDMKIPSGSGPPPDKLKASRAYSVATPAADKSRREPLRANNPGSIPTAGGKALGGAAREERERRKSRMSSDMGMPPLDKEGSPDPMTQNNTQANTIPQRMNNGEGSSTMPEERSPSAPVVDAPVGNAEPKVDAVEEPKTEGVPETKIDPPAEETKGDAVGELPATKENEPAPASKERRGSRLDDVLGKLKIGGKKK